MPFLYLANCFSEFSNYDASVLIWYCYVGVWTWVWVLLISVFSQVSFEVVRSVARCTSSCFVTASVYPVLNCTTSLNSLFAVLFDDRLDFLILLLGAFDKDVPF